MTFIVNPVAGQGRGRRVWDEMAPRLQAERCPHTVRFAEEPGHATALAAQALRDGARTVVSVGGDGTANEVVNGFFDRGALVNPQARIAFIPAGTGNDIARQFNLQDGALPGPATQHVDLLHVRCGSGSAVRDGLFHAGAGLPAEVVETSTRLKGRWGKLSYAGGSVVAIYRHRPRIVRFSCDGGPPVTARLSFIMASNGKYAGGGMLMAPPASMEDGVLDLITLQGASKLTMVFRLLPAVYRGAHMGHPAVGHLQARSVQIESDDPLVVQTDGELIGTTPVTIEVIPHALPVRVPGPPPEE
jgi:YegS/Rv2252/BmrU family lipid kinase